RCCSSSPNAGVAVSDDPSTGDMVHRPAQSGRHRYRPTMETAPPAELRALRAFACRLEPARALQSVDEAADFLADRGMLTRTADCALPSLFEACHEPPYRAGRGGFADWPETAYPWFWELAHRDGVYELAVHG